ncbi:DUF4365 domain-containing protein [Nocardia sp. NPDC003482]
MTHRPRSHEIASIAAAAVSRMWTDQGAAVEEVRNDYGEDLLVQTSHNGEMDDSRIWVQVKGREKLSLSKRAGSPPNLVVDSSHALRWVNTADLVVVVQWDITRNTGWYVIPKDVIRSYDLLESGRPTIGLRFEPNLILDAEAVNRITWDARLWHASRRISFARLSDINSIESLDRPHKAGSQEAAVTLLRLWHKMGIEFDESGSPRGKFDRLVRSAYKNLLEDDDDFIRDSNNRFLASIQLSLLATIQKVANTGLDTNLIVEMSEGMANVYMSAYGDIDAWERSRQT